jgi:hypothetical protein
MELGICYGFQIAILAIVRKAHYEKTAHIIKLNTEAVQNIAFLKKGQDIIKQNQQDF